MRVDGVYLNTKHYYCPTTSNVCPLLFQITSYGGNLTVSQLYRTWPGATRSSDTDVIIYGSGISVYWTNTDEIVPDRIVVSRIVPHCENPCFMNCMCNFHFPSDKFNYNGFVFYTFCNTSDSLLEGFPVKSSSVFIIVCGRLRYDWGGMLETGFLGLSIRSSGCGNMCFITDRKCTEMLSSHLLLK